MSRPEPFRKSSVLLCVTLLAFCSARTARAGPPFQTDDPDPVEYKHFEMYAFELSDSTGKNVGGTVLEIPAYEVNYGIVPNVQLHLVVPPTVAFLPSGGPTNYAMGDTELGTKIRLVKETRQSPEIGIFPFFEFPTGSVDKGTGVGKTWYRMPLWLQKSWGEEDHQWTTYGGAGETIVPQDGYKNFPFAGWLVQKQLNKKITLGGELFGHGAEGEAALSARSSTMLDLGGIYEFHDGFDLQFAAGRSIYGQPETYTYLSLYWTWGPKDTGKGDPGIANPPPGDSDKISRGTGSRMFSALTKMHLR